MKQDLKIIVVLLVLLALILSSIFIILLADYLVIKGYFSLLALIHLLAWYIIPKRLYKWIS